VAGSPCVIRKRKWWVVSSECSPAHLTQHLLSRAAPSPQSLPQRSHPRDFFPSLVLRQSAFRRPSMENDDESHDEANNGQIFVRFNWRAKF
jgi:hypothetical protein